MAPVIDNPMAAAETNAIAALLRQLCKPSLRETLIMLSSRLWRPRPRG
jgi:hypothetical protein